MSVRTCPHSDCAELNLADAIVCSTCGTRLVPDARTLARVRGHIRFTSVDVDPDAHAAGIALVVAEARARKGISL